MGRVKDIQRMANEVTVDFDHVAHKAWKAKVAKEGQRAREAIEKHGGKHLRSRYTDGGYVKHSFQHGGRTHSYESSLRGETNHHSEVKSLIGK